MEPDQVAHSRSAIGITLTAFKGGQAKSTTAMNTAGTLAQRGHPTLLVDCDPQANSSGIFVSWDKVQFSLRSTIVERVPVTEVIQPTRIPNLDVLPASFELSVLDKEMVISPRGVEKIRRALRPVENTYRFIIFDTAPGLSHLTLGALVASSYFVIPIAPEVWASHGLRMFVSWIDEQREEEVFDAKLLGLLATRVDTRTRVSKALLANLKAGDLPAFETFVPERVGAEDAVSARAIAGEPGSDPDISLAYNRFTDELLERVAKHEAEEGRHRG